MSLASVAFGCKRESLAVPVPDTLAEIPASLPRIQSIERYPVANAKRVLIHVRQIHESSIEAVIHSKEENATAEALACHRSIREGLSALLAAYPCDALYLEGLHQADVLSRREGVAKFRDLLYAVSRARSKIDSAATNVNAQETSSDATTPIARERVQSLLEETISRLDRNSVSHSTATQLAARFNLFLESPNSQEVEVFLAEISKPVDELDTLNSVAARIQERARGLAAQYSQLESVPTAVVEEMQSYATWMEEAAKRKTALQAEIGETLRTRRDVIYQKRDEALVELVSRRPENARGQDRALALWGAAHDLKPAVAAHNARHPENAIALVVITPQEVHEHAQRHPLRLW